MDERRHEGAPGRSYRGLPSSHRQAAERLCTVLRDAGFRALLAGGCVRDLILGVDPKDYDVATSATPEDVARLFPKCISVGAAFGVQIVMLPEGPFEVTTFRRDGPYGDGRHPDYIEFVDEFRDALRRDFTINAMFLDPVTGEILDLVNGREDIARRILRTVGEPRQRFEEDHLRLLRAIRFAARLDYAIAPETLEALRDMAASSVKTSPERVRDEILKCLTEGAARRAFALMDETGILRHVLPEVDRMKGVAQPPAFHPEGDVFDHTMLMLEMLEAPSPALAMAVLLHDVGKPLTQTIEDRIRFNNHDKAGARVAEEICRRFRMTNDDSARISWMVENHMRLEAAPKMRESKLKRFVRHEAFPELLELCRMDCAASHNSMETVEWVRAYLACLPAEQLAPPPLLRGSDLIDMGYAPGPAFSEILRAVEDAQLEGALDTAEEARRFVRANWPLRLK